jgi:signal transduction histidine kinase
MLGVPLIRHGEVIGTMGMTRSWVEPFTSRQIELVETFADQAVIAIENARLFEAEQARTREVEENLEFQTAANEVLQLIARSAFDLEPVLQEALDTAVRLCNADMGSIFQLEGDAYQWRVGNGLPPEYEAFERANRIRIDRRTLVGRAALARATVHIEDAWNDEEYGEKAEARMGRIRSMLGVPLLRDGQPIGVFALARGRLEPFTQRQIDLVTTFADQSVIAIQNVRLFNEITQKGRELELASQHKSQFLANMSHELRTPLNAILGYTELMQDGIYGELPEKAAGVLERVQTNGRHLLGLINSVLDLSKIEAGQLELDIVDYGLPGIVEAVIVATESLANEKRLELRSELAADLPRGRGDERRLTQVLLNLVGNAIKFTDKGGVTIGARQAADRFHVLVSDTGPGIPPSEQERIFEEFHQMDNSNTKAKGGTGLGLAIAKRIIELHGGRIWVESAPGCGATFHFDIPLFADGDGKTNG